MPILAILTVNRAVTKANRVCLVTNSTDRKSLINKVSYLEVETVYTNNLGLIIKD